MSKTELITMIENAGFEAVERDTVYNRVEIAKAKQLFMGVKDDLR